MVPVLSSNGQYLQSGLSHQLKPLSFFEINLVLLVVLEVEGVSVWANVVPCIGIVGVLCVRTKKSSMDFCTTPPLGVLLIGSGVLGVL